MTKEEIYTALQNGETVVFNDGIGGAKAIIKDDKLAVRFANTNVMYLYGAHGEPRFNLKKFSIVSTKPMETRRYKTVVILVNADVVAGAREILQDIEGTKFSSEKSLRWCLEAEGIEECGVYEMSEFMTDWNDTDDDIQPLTIADSFMGYALIKL